METSCSPSIGTAIAAYLLVMFRSSHGCRRIRASSHVGVTSSVPSAHLIGPWYPRSRRTVDCVAGSQRRREKGRASATASTLLQGHQQVHSMQPRSERHGHVTLHAQGHGRVKAPVSPSRTPCEMRSQLGLPAAFMACVANSKNHAAAAAHLPCRPCTEAAVPRHCRRRRPAQQPQLLAAIKMLGTASACTEVSRATVVS